MRIFKYEMPLDGSDLLLPMGARILAVRDQANALCLWAEVSPHTSLETRRIRVVPTGGTVPMDGIYIGSFFPQDAQFVFHVYEIN